MRIQYNKLVRDRIPEIIRAEGKECETRILSDSQYRQALREKLLEEANEVAHSNKEELPRELGDLLEVIDALFQAYDLEERVIEEERAVKHQQRGGFDSQIELIWVEE